MFVARRMQKSIVTVTPSASLAEAQDGFGQAVFAEGILEGFGAGGDDGVIGHIEGQFGDEDDR